MLPINFEFLFIKLHNYEGIYFFIAILSAIFFFTYLCKQNNVNLDLMYEAIFICLLVALITGRLFSFLLWNPIELLKNPIIFFQPWNGGITVAGGVLGGLIAGAVFAKVKKLNFFYYIRFFIPPILIGQIIGRFGCFLNGDAAGKPTDLPWGVIFARNSAAYYSVPHGTPLHPTQLYEIFANLLLLFFILITGKNEWITKRRVIWYAFGYSIIRFIIEFFRNDSEKWFGIFTTGQQICLIGFGIALILLIWSLFNDQKMNKEEINS
ncbi:MAG TPA: prolipoprotein diacylglyceryl transferase [Spirochaetota bacterium]|nr:prolipoprotein diacylglyceryl transferase [Spirochaetota bacterium]